MTTFDNTRWADGEFSLEYRENADNYLPDRYKLVEIAKSLYEYFIDRHHTCRVLDLGCGDGLLVQELMKRNRIEATLVDASSEMLDAAKKRLADFETVRYINASFQDLLTTDVLKNTFDFILSSFAIHHLRMGEKEALFKYIYSLLNPGGFFLNIDVVLSPAKELEDWYLGMWSDWIDGHVSDSIKNEFLDVPRRYKNDPDNRPDTLSEQLRALERTGFQNVDCYYKFGIFSMFGGRKSGMRTEPERNRITGNEGEIS